MGMIRPVRFPLLLAIAALLLLGCPGRVRRDGNTVEKQGWGQNWLTPRGSLIPGGAWIAPNERLRHNSIEDRWEYATDAATLRHNTIEDVWSLVEPGHQLRHNTITGRWEFASWQAKLRKSPMSGEWSFVEPGSYYQP